MSEKSFNIRWYAYLMFIIFNYTLKMIAKSDVMYIGGKVHGYSILKLGNGWKKMYVNKKKYIGNYVKMDS